MITGFPPGDAHVGLEMVNGTFHGSPCFIKGVPFIRITLNAGEHAEIHVVVGISGTSLFCGGAGLLAVADPLSFYHMDFGTNPFEPVRAPFFMAASGVFHIKAFVFWTGRISVNVVTDLFEGAFVPWIVGNEGSGEMKLIFESAINFNGIESGITQKGMRVETGMAGEEIGEDGPQG